MCSSDLVACPVFSVAYPRGDVLAALGAFKLAFRRRFCDPTDSVRTALHAPATLYELLFHDALLRAPPRTNGLAAGDLMAIRALAGQLAEAGGARPGDFAVLLDTFQDSPEKIARRHLDLGLVRVDARGAIVEFAYLLKDGRFAPQDRPAYAPSALRRLLQDATLAWGDARAFARCLDHHADRFLADREAWRAGRDVEGNFGNAFFTADEMRKHLDAGVPPPLSDGWIARLERSVVARLAVLPGSAISVRS